LTITNWFLELWARLRPADVVDIAVVSVVTYVTVTWLRSARTRFVLAGLALLAGLYLVARLLDMVLTLLIFQAGITLAAVTLIVVFQEDIRRAFERIAMQGRLRRRATPSAHADLSSVLVGSLTDLAERRVGALIVIRGQEPLERHLSGGFRLEGHPTRPLLASIFDPGSSGHDGAVIIDRGLVEKFGVRLPLSTNVPDGATYGTRHTAALGLSERSDALVLVASEERGTVSVARAGKLERDVSEAELSERISEFLAEHWPERHVSFARRLFARDLGTKAIAVAVAATAWAVVISRENELVARTVTVPIVVRDVPASWVLDEPKPIEARVTLSGPGRAFTLLDVGRLAFSVGADRIQLGEHKVTLRDHDLGLPPGLTVHRIDPDQVTIAAYETVVVTLPIKPVALGHLRAGLRLGRLEATPKTVQVRVRKAARRTFLDIRTEPVDLDALSGPTQIARALVLPDDVRFAEGAPREAMVSVEVVGVPR
jgi:diadenylate cyclase